MKKNKHIGSNFDDFLKEEGILEEVKVTALKKVISYRSLSMVSTVKFIIGKSKRGKNIEASCEMKKILKASKRVKSYLLKSDPYLTPIMFEKKVLDRYYSEPDKYSIEDGILRTKDWSWTLSIDNNQMEHIMVYLGDLSCLPQQEQFHWRSCNINIPPKISSVAYARDFYSEFRDPKSPDLIFKKTLILFNQKFEKKYGWQLFKSLQVDDSYCLEALTIPSINSQKQFDEAILYLAKILNDSINVKKLNEILVFNADEQQEGSISKLSKFLISHNLDKNILEVLRILQEFRSKGSAHRKGDGYTKLTQKNKISSLQTKFAEILTNCILFLDKTSESLFLD